MIPARTSWRVDNEPPEGSTTGGPIRQAVGREMSATGRTLTVRSHHGGN